MVDVALMRDLGPIPSIFNITSHVAGRKLDFSSSIPQQSRQKVCWRWRLLQANTPARALDTQEVSQDLQRSKRWSVTDLTDLEIDRADVELVLGRNGSRTTPGRIRRGETHGGSPRTIKAA
jgi:hypothetical protein